MNSVRYESAKIISKPPLKPNIKLTIQELFPTWKK